MASNLQAQPADDTGDRKGRPGPCGAGQTQLEKGALCSQKVEETRPVPPDPSKEPAGWRSSLVVFAVASAITVWLFQPEISAAVQVWSNSETFGHAFFILPISLLLLYRLRHRLAALPPAPAPWAIVPILGLTVLWAIGDLANLMVVKQLAFVGLWQSLFLLVLGWQISSVALFPLAYLYLAVPFGHSVIPALQDVTAQIVVHLLRFTGLPVFLDGYFIQIPSGSFLVAEACSGVRYLIVSVALGILTAYLFFTSWRRRLLFVALSAVVPIIANGIRAYGIIMLAHLSDYQIAVDVDHVVYGFVFLGVVTLSLLGLAALLRDRYVSTLPEPPALGATERPFRQHEAVRTTAIQMGGVALAIAAVVLAHMWTAAAKAPPANLTPALDLPQAVAPWQALPDAPTSWNPRFRGNDLDLHGSYQLGKEQVDVHVAYYAYQREGAEAINDLNLVAGKEWQARHLTRTSTTAGGKALPYVRLILSSRDETFVVWYWYRVAGESTNSPIHGKLLELKALLMGGEKAAAVIAIGAKVTEDAHQADDLLQSFVERVLDEGGNLLRVDSAQGGAVTDISR